MTKILKTLRSQTARVPTNWFTIILAALLWSIPEFHIRDQNNKRIVKSRSTFNSKVVRSYITLFVFFSASGIMLWIENAFLPAFPDFFHPFSVSSAPDD